MHQNEFFFVGYARCIADIMSLGFFHKLAFKSYSKVALLVKCNILNTCKFILIIVHGAYAHLNFICQVRCVNIYIYAGSYVAKSFDLMQIHIHL